MGRLLVLSPQLSSYSIDLKSGVNRTVLDGGLARYRRDIIGCVSLVNVTWIGQWQEFEYLRAFYRAATLNGSLPFNINLKTTSSISELHEDVYFIPGSFRFLGKQDNSYTIGAQLAVALET